MLSLLLLGLRFVYKQTIITAAHGVRHRPACSKNTPPLAATSLRLTISLSMKISGLERRPPPPKHLLPLGNEREPDDELEMNTDHVMRVTVSGSTQR